MDRSQRMNEAAYLGLRAGIDTQYPSGQFVAIADGQVVADAASFDDLLVSLRKRGMEPSNVLVVQAGVEPLTEAIILLVTEGT